MVRDAEQIASHSEKKDKKTIKDSYREENNVHDPDKIELS